MYCLFCLVLCIVCVYLCSKLLLPGGYPIAVKYVTSISGIVRLGKSKHFEVLSITVVGSNVCVFCTTLGAEKRVVFRVSCQLLLKQNWGSSTNIGRTSHRAAN